jgi:LmbE family N-acetylglucosaminyl deacetylase
VQEDYQHVYFSPHLDDVVLSCAGRIARQTAAGDRVLVVTIFAGSRGDAVPAPHARSLDWAPFQDLAARRREDRRALQALAADHRWLDYPDAIQRHRRYASVTGITAPLPRREAALRAQVGASIADVGRRCPAATLYFPLGIGNHVDHQLVSAAGLDRRQVNSPQARGLLFYEDTPYVCIPHLLRQRFEQLGIRAPSGSPPPVLARARETHAALLAAPQLGRHLRHRGAVARILLFAYLVTRFARARAGARRREWITMRPELVDIEAVFETKVAAIGSYRSQVQALFGDLDELRRVLAACAPGAAAGTPHERYWRAAGAPDPRREGRQP